MPNTLEAIVLLNAGRSAHYSKPRNQSIECSGTQVNVQVLKVQSIEAIAAAGPLN